MKFGYMRNFKCIGMLCYSSFNDNTWLIDDSFFKKMEAKRKLIEDQYHAGLSNAEIFKALKPFKITRKTVWNVVIRLKSTNTTDAHPRSVHPQSIRTPGLIKAVREKICWKARRTMRKMSKEHQVSTTSMWRVVKQGLSMTPLPHPEVSALACSHNPEEEGHGVGLAEEAEGRHAP